ncbi:MAG: hypothetical protein QM692_22445, partial [Thermomicrobiales bacterium]
MPATAAPSVVFPETSERWARALDHALHAGVEILTTPAGERFASSGEHLDLIYRVTPDSCDCARALAGDPVCPHRAALRSVLGSLPVVLLHVDDLPADALHPNDCACPACFDSLEAAMWGWIAHAHAANAALQVREVLEEVQQDGHRDVVRQVRDEHRRLAGQFGDAQRIGVDDGEELGVDAVLGH